MESLELSITDVFPMRKRRATGLGDTGRTKNDLNAKLDETKPESCIVKTPVRKLNATSNSSRRKQGRSSVERNEGQRPGKTPTRLNFSPNALGRLRKTPQRLAAWGSFSPSDSGPEIVWDNDSHSPTIALNKGREKSDRSKSAQDQLALIIKKLSSDNKKSLTEQETNLFAVWMKKDESEKCNSRLVGKGCVKKRSFLSRSKAVENPRPSVQRRVTRNRGRITSFDAVKIQEELSNFVKDINEKDNKHGVQEGSDNTSDREADPLRTEAIPSNVNSGGRTSVDEIAMKGNSRENSLSGELEGIFLDASDDDSLMGFDDFAFDQDAEEPVEKRRGPCSTLEAKVKATRKTGNGISLTNDVNTRQELQGVEKEQLDMRKFREENVLSRGKTAHSSCANFEKEKKIPNDFDSCTCSKPSMINQNLANEYRSKSFKSKNAACSQHMLTKPCIHKFHRLKVKVEDAVSGNKIVDSLLKEAGKSQGTSSDCRNENKEFEKGHQTSVFDIDIDSNPRGKRYETESKKLDKKSLPNKNHLQSNNGEVDFDKMDGEFTKNHKEIPTEFELDDFECENFNDEIFDGVSKTGNENAKKRGDGKEIIASKLHECEGITGAKRVADRDSGLAINYDFDEDDLSDCFGLIDTDCVDIVDNTKHLPAVVSGKKATLEPVSGSKSSTKIDSREIITRRTNKRVKCKQMSTTEKAKKSNLEDLKSFGYALKENVRRDSVGHFSINKEFNQIDGFYDNSLIDILDDDIQLLDACSEMEAKHINELKCSNEKGTEFDVWQEDVITDHVLVANAEAKEGQEILKKKNGTKVADKMKENSHNGWEGVLNSKKPNNFTGNVKYSCKSTENKEFMQRPTKSDIMKPDTQRFERRPNSSTSNSDCQNHFASNKEMVQTTSACLSRQGRTLFCPNVSLIATEDNGQSTGDQDDRFWDDVLCPRKAGLAPFTSTQKGCSAPNDAAATNSVGIQQSRPHRFTAAEIERKKAEAQKRLEQRMLRMKNGRH